MCCVGTSSPCYNDVEMLTENNWDDCNIRRVFIRKVKALLILCCTALILLVELYFTVNEFICSYSFVNLGTIDICMQYCSTNVIISGVQHLDAPASGHTCDCCTVYFLVSFLSVHFCIIYFKM